MKRTVPLLITALGGFVLIGAYFIPPAQSWGEKVSIWFDILASIAFILGGANLFAEVPIEERIGSRALAGATRWSSSYRSSLRWSLESGKSGCRLRRSFRTWRGRVITAKWAAVSGLSFGTVIARWPPRSSPCWRFTWPPQRSAPFRQESRGCSPVRHGIHCSSGADVCRSRIDELDRSQELVRIQILHRAAN